MHLCAGSEGAFLWGCPTLTLRHYSQPPRFPSDHPTFLIIISSWPLWYDQDLQIVFQGTPQKIKESTTNLVYFAGGWVGRLDHCGGAGRMDDDRVPGVWQDAGGRRCQVQLWILEQQFILTRGNGTESLQSVRALLSANHVGGRMGGDDWTINSIMMNLKMVIHISIAARETLSIAF